jgi:alanine racemase
VGYADGYPRRAPLNTPLLLNGMRVPLIGRVSMDMITIDLRLVPEAKVGDPIELWGENLPIEEVASHMGTLGYELLTSLSPRVLIELQ